MNSIIFVYGMPGSFKTTISNILWSRLNRMYLSPSQYGKAHDENGNIIQSRREERYYMMFEHLKLIEELPINIVIDGCFDLKKAEIKIKELLENKDVNKVLFIKCFTSDIEKSVKRITARNNNKSYQDYVNPNQEYFTMLYHFDNSIDKFIIKNGYPLIAYDSSCKNITNYGNTNNCDSNLINIEEILGLLRENKIVLN